MSAFLNLRSPSGPLDSFSPEVLLSLQELPEFACLDVEELRNLPGLEARHTLGSLGEMLEELSVLPASQQTDHHQQVLRLNPSLPAASSWSSRRSSKKTILFSNDIRHN